jgi:hypothetical protein
MRALATLSTQDGAATTLIQVDVATRAIQCSFVLGSMLSLHFRMDRLSDMDRARWLELMRGGESKLAFLWGESRWEADYMICAAHKYFTNVYAFSPLHIEAAMRLTPEVTRKLLDWLKTYWTVERPPDRSSKVTGW